jgi:hypothetical protein
MEKDFTNAHFFSNAHTYNPSYTRGRDQEDLCLKPAWTNKEFTRPYLEKLFTKKRTGGVAQGEGPEFKPQYPQKKKKNSRI